jgi:hypothetical protein
MFKKFKSITVPPDQVDIKLTELCTECEDLLVHNVMPALTQFQQPVLYVLTEVHFKDEEQSKRFDALLNPKSMLHKN